LLAAGLFFLCGCSTPSTIIETVEVRVPVIEPCPVSIPDTASYAAEKLSVDDTDFEKIRALLIERRQRISTEEELRALLLACVIPLNPSDR
jgi:hypothetical protein